MDALGSSDKRNETQNDVRPILGAGLADLTGKQIGRYLIGQQLGSGGVATVYRAYDQVQGQTVALKLLLSGADDKAYTRFRNEAMTAGALRHPHIVRILQIGTAPHGEVAYIAMDLVEGESLADLLRQRGRLRPEESANLLEPIARALAVAHNQGVVHRDVKPGNILLRPVSPGAPNSVQIEAFEHPVVPLLTDFGIARVLDAPELTSMGRTVGTPAYMAPEQCAGSREIDGRADIYALGAVLYRCIAGRLPFSGTTTQILHAHVYEPLTIEDSVYRQLSPLMVEVLQRSMAKRPEDRYANATELADALAVAAGRSVRHADVAANETTATLTMTALPATSAAVESSSTTMLVPAPGVSGARSTHPLLRSATAGGLSSTPTTQSSASLSALAEPRGAATSSNAPGVQSQERKRTSVQSILLILVGGLIVMAIGVLLGMQAPRMLRPSLPGAGLFAPVTPTPPVEDSSATFDQEPTAALVAALPETPSPEATGTAQPASTLAPDLTAPPDETATELPTASPMPTLTPTPTVTQTPTLAPTATPDPEATLIACLPLVAETLQRYVTALPPSERSALGCPLAEAQVGAAQMMPLERGYMVGLNEANEVYIVYLGSEAWERSALIDSNEPVDVEPPDGLYLPVGRFLPLWAANERWERLGFAVEPQPVDFTVVIQPFAGAVLIGNRDSVEVAVLPVGGD